jgi:hypothetical protein
MPAQLLSTDPNAGLSPSVANARPQRPSSAPPFQPTRISQIADALQGPVTDEVPSMHAPTATEPVTLDDLQDNPIVALQRIGAFLKRDATNPRNWLSLAVLYFGPKAFPSAATAISKGLSATARKVSAVGRVLEPGDVGLVSPRLGRAADLAGRVREAVRPTASAPAEAGPVATGAAPPGAVPGAPAAPAGPGSALPPPETVAPRPSPTVTEPPVVKPKMTAAEVTEYTRLRRRKMTDAEAKEAILAARSLAARLGGASSEEVRKAVKHRNETDAW